MYCLRQAHYTLSKFLFGPSSRGQNLIAGACSQASTD